MKKKLKKWLVPIFAAALSLAAAIPAFAAETVKVTIPNVKGGYLSASYCDENTDWITNYLPIGKETEIPKGTKLYIEVMAFDYDTVENTYVSTFLDSIFANGEKIDLGEPQELVGNDWLDFSWTCEEDTVFEAKFQGQEIKFSPENANKGGKIYQLVFQSEKDNRIGMKAPKDFNEKIVIKSQYIRKGSKIEYLDLSEAEFCELESVGQGMADCFRLTEDGVLKASKDTMKAGWYRVDLKFKMPQDNDVRINSLIVNVGCAATVDVPRVVVPDGDGYSPVIMDFNESVMANLNPDIDTVGKLVRMKNEDSFFETIDGFETIEKLARLDKKKGTLTACNNADTLKKYMDSDYICEFYAILKGYDIPIVEKPDTADIYPWVEYDWHQDPQTKKWYYGETNEKGIAVLAKNKWVEDEDGEMVWVGADGAMVTNGIAGDPKDDRYWVNEYGQIDDSFTGTKVIDDVDYVFESGKLVSVKMHLATPSNAAEATAQVERVLANQDKMTPDEKIKAADMLTEALKKSVDASKLTSAELTKYEALYKAAFGAENIELEADGAANEIIIGGIAAAGLTSADFVDGAVTIRYAASWIASASNARARSAVETSGSSGEKVSVKLLVNENERKALLVPVTIKIGDMPTDFVDSYDSTKYNYKVEDAKDVAVDTKSGVLTMTVRRTGVFELKAVLKNTNRPSSGSSGSHHSGSSGGGRATVKADYYKTGSWKFDSKGWWFQYDDGSWPANTWVYLPWNNESKWYYFNEEGYMVTGWHLWNSNYYYLYPTADGNQGYMFTGWHEIGGKWYYFSLKNDATLGAMAHDTMTPDGYRVDKDGAWIK